MNLPNGFGEDVGAEVGQVVAVDDVMTACRRFICAMAVATREALRCHTWAGTVGNRAVAQLRVQTSRES